MFCSAPRIVQSIVDDKIIQDKEVEHSLISLFTAFHQSGQQQQLADRHVTNTKIMLNTHGFAIERNQSLLKDGGRGVFVASGYVKSGSIVAMYPGMLLLVIDCLTLYTCICQNSTNIIQFV